MLSVEIKVNDSVVKEFYVVRRDDFKGWGATHEYDAGMIVRLDLPGSKPDVYPMGRIEHRYCAGAVSLAEKMLKLARQKGMHK
jgi:hypothetical protein